MSAFFFLFPKMPFWCLEVFINWNNWLCQSSPYIFITLFDFLHFISEYKFAICYIAGNSHGQKWYCDFMQFLCCFNIPFLEIENAEMYNVSSKQELCNWVSSFLLIYLYRLYSGLSLQNDETPFIVILFGMTICCWCEPPKLLRMLVSNKHKIMFKPQALLNQNQNLLSLIKNSWTTKLSWFLYGLSNL